MKVEFWAGPFDGTQLSRRATPALYVWTDGKRCYRRPRPGMALYRRDGYYDSVGNVLRYEHVGTRVGLCEACGSFNQFNGNRACVMCGHGLVGDLAPPRSS